MTARTTLCAWCGRPLLSTSFAVYSPDQPTATHLIHPECHPEAVRNGFVDWLKEGQP